MFTLPGLLIPAGAGNPARMVSVMARLEKDINGYQAEGLGEVIPCVIEMPLPYECVIVGHLLKSRTMSIISMRRLIAAGWPRSRSG